MLGDLRGGADDHASGTELVRRLARELALDVGIRAPEYDARHQRPAHLLRWPAGLLQQLVQAVVELCEPFRRHQDSVPLVGVAGCQGERPPHAITADDDRRAAGPWRARHQHGVAQPVELTVERDGPVAPQESGYALEALLEAGEPAVDVQQVEAVGLVLALLPARAHAEPETAAGEVVDG